MSVSLYPELGLDKRIQSTNRITLRIPTSTLKVLKAEADRRDIPLNALVIKILSRSIAFDTTVNTMPNIILPYLLFAKILDDLDNSSIEKLVKEGPHLVGKLFMILGIKYGLKEVIENYLIVLGKYCGWYNFTYESNGPHYRLVFETQIGSNWTRFLAEYIRSLLESLRVYIETNSINDNVIVFELRDYGAS
jgi:hypothetical protein